MKKKAPIFVIFNLYILQKFVYQLIFSIKVKKPALRLTQCL
ncbi:hypothetical protein NCDO763_2337 [Lactococcus cremoris]|uniref:Uncharacterized protein n=1 Tax=Lactococcus cremoris subsp. tructae TaxID=542833 RepID=A0A2A5SX12_LACLC|nr:hypothetical protein N41_0445 [Lactococcus cremoris]KZK49037.1 hypothetical protein NCDO763_2337 [Lactococcus cremoris]PCS20480.1 hypothetical protein RU92_GL000128 [Lactococcus cremoris subsp. tructae]